MIQLMKGGHRPTAMPFWGIVPRALRRHRLIKLLIRIAPSRRVSLLKYNSGAGEAFGDLLDGLTRSVLVADEHYPQFTAVSRALFPSRDAVMFDVGAHMGLMSFTHARALRDGAMRAHLFEANPACINILKLTAHLYPPDSVTVNWCCVSDHAGVSGLTFDADELSQGHISERQGLEVPNLILDHYVATHDISQIHLLKIDVEGWEPNVLSGASEAIRRGAIDAIYTEISSEALERRGLSANEYFGQLRETGYDLFLVRDEDLAHLSDGERRLISTATGGQLRVKPLQSVEGFVQTDVLALRPGTWSFID
jgi:FkbM family methyltransferase